MEESYKSSGICERIGRGLKLKCPKELTSISYCDSNYAQDADDRKSISGRVNTIGGMITNYSSKKQATVTLSSTEAEYISLSDCCQETKFQWMLLRELTGSKEPGTIYEDNTGAIFLVKNQQVGPRMKHIDVRHHFIRGPIEENIVDVKFVRSEENVSDIMTKNLPEKSFNKHKASLLEGTIEAWR